MRWLLIYGMLVMLLSSCSTKRQTQTRSLEVDSMATKEVKIGYLINRKELTNADVVITEIDYVPDADMPATVIIDSVGTLEVIGNAIVGIKHTAVNYTNAKDTHKDTQTEERAKASKTKIEEIKQSEMVSPTTNRSLMWVLFPMVIILTVGVVLYLKRFPVIGWLRRMLKQ